MVNEQLGRLVERVEGKEGESLVEGKDWIKVAELWIKIATKVSWILVPSKRTRLADFGFRSFSTRLVSSTISPLSRRSLVSSIFLRLRQLVNPRTRSQRQHPRH